MATTSFFPAKPLGCYGDGGAIFTNDDHLALEARRFHNHGEESRYHHVKVGMNGRLDAMQAAVLLEKLRVFESEIEKRQRVALRYFDGLVGVDGIVLPTVLEHNKSVFAQFTIRVKDREQFRDTLQNAGFPRLFIILYRSISNQLTRRLVSYSIKRIARLKRS